MENQDNVTSEQPCPICQHTDWCWIKTNRGGDIALVGCRRHGEDVRRDKSGAEYYLHKLAEDDDGAGHDAVPERRHSHGSADADALHVAYSVFLDHLRLNVITARRSESVAFMTTTSSEAYTARGPNGSIPGRQPSAPSSST